MFEKRQLLDIFLTKLVLNLRSEASKTYLGYAWWILEPLLHVAVLYVVFGKFLDRGTADFPVFLAAGQIPFLWFSKSVINSSNSIMASRGLINQVAIHKAFFPLLVVFQDLVKQLFAFLLLLAFLVFFDYQPAWIWLLAVFVALAQFLLIIACALVVAAIIPFLPDFKFIIASGMMLLMFASGIFYSYKQVILEEHQQLFLLNPMANLIKNYREVLMEYQAPDWQALFWIGFISLLVIYLMTRLYTKADTAFARVVVQ